MARPSSASTPIQRGGEGAPTRVDDEGDTQRREGDNAHILYRGGESDPYREEEAACAYTRGGGGLQNTMDMHVGCSYTEGRGWVLLHRGEGVGACT